MQKLKEEKILFYNQHKEDLQEGLWFFIDGYKNNQSLNHLQHKVPCYEAEIPDDIIVYDFNLEKLISITDPLVKLGGCYIPKRLCSQITNIKRRSKLYMNNINNFINGFEQFKKRIDAIPDEQLIKECETLGMEFEQEIPKYHKNTGSNISKISKKSKHKHNYEECILRYESNYFGKHNIYTRLSSYCSICGKIGEKLKDSIVKDYHRTGMLSNGIKYHSIISGDELFEEYKDRLPVFHIDDNTNKRYVNLDENDNVNGE